MRCEIETEMEIPMCLDDICIPMEVPIEINATDSPLSHLCSISISFGSEMVYEGPIGEHGFVMQITELEPRGDYALKFAANCSKLHSLLDEPIESVKLVIRGYEEIEEEISFGHDFSLEWS